jgi:lipoprotein-anchoring transpeptidase ErfK/SrfK
MKRAALVAGVSIATLLFAGPSTVWAAWNSESWWGNNSVTASPPEAAPKRIIRHKPAERKADRDESKIKAPVPTGVLHIIVSIDKQRATLFADGRPFASTAISSGTPGHPTPMGLFTVIQKDRHHVSNLYNASMPYMQRITWSGSALHEGPLPGYPASHGCVRLTTSFAQLLWRTTKMGARVIVTHPDVAPLDFDHARLFVPRPKLVAAPPKPAEPPVKVAEVPKAPAASPVPPAVVPAAEPAATATVARIRTADAGNSTVIAVTSVVGDASKPVATSVETAPAANAPATEQATKVAATDGAGETQAATPAEPVEAKAAAEPPAEEKPAAEPSAAPPAESKSAEAKPVEVLPVEAKPAEARPVVAEPAPAITAPAPIIVDERPKIMPPAVLQEANGRPISVFASLKERKLYVRQGWKPLFEAPISFEQPEQPVGTHVYTAMGVKADGTGLRWTVVSIPSSTRRVAELQVQDGRKRHHEPAKAVDVSVPMPSPAAALDRIVMPPELVERISELITPGSSLIVSDNRLSDETGEYTDFIVLTR